MIFKLLCLWIKKGFENCLNGVKYDKLKLLLLNKDLSIQKVLVKCASGGRDGMAQIIE
jgi:hypothetical protein